LCQYSATIFQLLGHFVLQTHYHGSAPGPHWGLTPDHLSEPPPPTFTYRVMPLDRCIQHTSCTSSLHEEELLQQNLLLTCPDYQPFSSTEALNGYLSYKIITNLSFHQSLKSWQSRLKHSCIKMYPQFLIYL